MATKAYVPAWTDADRAERDALRAVQEGVRRETAAARAAFEHTVVADFGRAVEAYFAWTDALYRSHFLGAEPLMDIPHFAEVVDRILYVAAPKRSDAVAAAIRAERHGEGS